MKPLSKSGKGVPKKPSESSIVEKLVDMIDRRGDKPPSFFCCKVFVYCLLISINVLKVEIDSLEIDSITSQEMSENVSIVKGCIEKVYCFRANFIFFIWKN